MQSIASDKGNSHQNSRLPIASPSTDRVLHEELGKATNIVKSDTIPEEGAVQNALQICENLAKSLVESARPLQAPGKLEKTATSNLLSLEEEPRQDTKPGPEKPPETPPIDANAANKVSLTAFGIITDPKVFITPNVLSTYVNIQNMLGRPQSFPQVFDLYASKPIPQSGASPTEYRDPAPDRASSAIPLPLAENALTAAIEQKDLPLCLEIITTSVGTAAYRKNKAVRKALLPATGLALAPAAAYAVSSQLALLQHSMDTQTATQIFFAGILAYVGFTAAIGVVAITTSNDQMDRITWAKGTPLRDRWLREDERAMIDRVAGAWGFQELTMRGEEDSAEWESLREWVGQRALVLDNPELMDGME